MATLYITEYQSIAIGMPGYAAPIPLEPGTDQAALTFTTAASSAAFAAGTRFVRIWSDTACRVKFGTAPTAVAASQPLAADTEYFRGVPEAGGYKVSAYDGSS